MLQENAGPVGTAATASGLFASFAAVAIPALQITLLIISIIVGILTARWYARKLRKDQ